MKNESPIVGAGDTVGGCSPLWVCGFKGNSRQSGLSGCRSHSRGPTCVLSRGFPRPRASAEILWGRFPVRVLSPLAAASIGWASGPGCPQAGVCPVGAPLPGTLLYSTPLSTVHSGLPPSPGPKSIFKAFTLQPQGTPCSVSAEIAGRGIASGAPGPAGTSGMSL